MDNRENPKIDFIREQIKEKPVNKKKLLNRLGTAALCGIVFALAVVIVILAFSSLIAKVYGDKLASQNNQPELFPNNITEDSSTEETSAESTVPSGPESNAEVTIIEKNWTLSDYQTLQNQLYTIGGQANKSIVTITGVVTDTDWFNNSYETEGTESGVIIAETNTQIQILTQRKGIADASKIYVTFIDDKIAEAQLLKYDGNTGIAILSVDKNQLEQSTMTCIGVAVLGTSSTVLRGTIAIALGSPLGTSYSILTGNITSTTNQITTTDGNYSVFTTDIVGSKKDSGILINTNGEVIGFIMQDYSSSQAENTLTAIHISELKPVIEMLLAGKDIPYLGLQVSTVTKKIAQTNDLPKGVYVKSVIMDSPAMAGGIQSGDVIVKIAGEEVLTEDAYQRMILSLKPGETYKIELKRQGALGYTDVSCEVTGGILQ